MADELIARKLKSINLVMRTRTLSFAARCVAWYLYERLNRLNLRSWPSQETIADELGANIKTVKRAIGELQAAGVIQVIRVDRRNEYVLALVSSAKGKSGLEISPQSGPREKGTKTGLNRGQKRAVDSPLKGDKNGPLYPLTKSPLSKPFSKTASTEARGEGIRQPVEEPVDRLREQRGDEVVERKLIEILDQKGFDGLETLSRLHEIDNGQPRLRLFQVYRNGSLNESHINSAVLLTKSNPAPLREQRKVRR